jgi:hypothetical protein
LAVPTKFRIRIFKLAIACAFSVLVVLVVSYLKYTQTDGWNDVVVHLYKAPVGALIFLFAATLLIFDYLSIVFFRFGIEKNSDEIAFRSIYDGTGNPLPSELKMLFHPLIFIGFLIFV